MTKDSGYEGFSADERAAMKEYAAELKRAKGGNKTAAEFQACLDAFAAMPDDDRIIGETLHGIVAKVAPHLLAKTWYGMPAYADDGKVIVFFKPKSKFKMRYSEVGFNEPAKLDDGDMWATVFAVVAMTPAVEDALAALVAKAAS